MKRVKENHVRDTYSSMKYWNHAAIHQRATPDGELDEHVRANPDSLDQAMSMYEVSEAAKEVQERVRKLLDLAKQILTEQQYNVFVMRAVKEPALTEREIAKVLSITPGRVHQLWETASKKLQKAYEDRTAEGK